MAYYGSSFSISHHLSENGHCSVGWDAPIIFFLGALGAFTALSFYQASPRAFWLLLLFLRPESLQNQEHTSKIVW